MSSKTDTINKSKVINFYLSRYLEGGFNKIFSDIEATKKDYSYIKAGMLPPEEFEIRHALKMMILNENMLSRFSPLKKIFYKKDFQDVKIAAKYWREVLLNLMNKSPQHKAAIKRIASTITGDGIERLKPFLK
ncbi:hypothetical protein [Acinetobacter baumannii]|uniref:hypothetical protein n=1 Tax=Acinetobacter baumannii TaxID=470 RepID=UPI001D0E9694|nr:hypothetical protein [Acinetobacter baumannii]